MSTDWSKILVTALDQAAEARGLPLVGAAFYSYVTSAATEYGTIFPPSEEDFKFREFLESHCSSVWVIPRTRQDFLVLRPNGARDLVEKFPHVTLDQRMFKAFTRIRENTHYFDPYTNTISDSEYNSIPIPTPTSEIEQKVREDFLKQHGIEGDELEPGPEEPSLHLLSHYSRLIHERGLKEEWRDYRLAEVISRVERWSRENSLAWRTSWLHFPEDRDSISLHSPIPSGKHWSRFLRGIQDLNQEELARISIPLDLVKRLLSE